MAGWETAFGNASKPIILCESTEGWMSACVYEPAIEAEKGGDETDQRWR